MKPTQVIEKWIDAYNSHNPDAMSEIYHDNVTNIQLPWDKVTQGREAMRDTFINVFKAFPDIRIKIENIIENDPWITIEWSFSGTMKGSFAGNPPNNNSFNMRGCEIFKINNGKILIQHGYWDKATMFSQLKLQ